MTGPFPAGPLRRVVTAHEASTSKAVFSRETSDSVSFQGFPVPPDKPPTCGYALAYSTSSFPVQGLSPPSASIPDQYANIDVKLYRSKLSANPQPLPDPTGTTCVILEAPRGQDVPMHRTVTLDYGVILDGSTELVLDSGEKKVLNRGDVFVQRGTAHSWRNITDVRDNNGKLRIFFVFLPIEKVKVDAGKEIEQDLTLSLKM